MGSTAVVRGVQLDPADLTPDLQNGAAGDLKVKTDVNKMDICIYMYSLLLYMYTLLSSVTTV